MTNVKFNLLPIEETKCDGCFTALPFRGRTTHYYCKKCMKCPHLESSRCICENGCQCKKRCTENENNKHEARLACPCKNSGFAYLNPFRDHEKQTTLYIHIPKEENSQAQ